MIISLIEVLQLPNFGQMNTSRIYVDSRDKILLATSWRDIMMSQPLF